MSETLSSNQAQSLAAEGIAVQLRSNKKIMWEKFLQHKLAVVASIFLLLLATLCFLAPVIAPYEFDAIDLYNIRSAPSMKHLLGTDALGRDLLTRLLFGGRISITIGLTAALLGSFVGTVIGSSAGYFGGRIDNLLMRFTDLAYSIPTLPLIIVISSYSNTQAFGIVVIIGLFSWMQTARVVRGAILSVKENEYVTAARALGAKDRLIILRHVLPNISNSIIVGATLGVGNAIITESSLSFLGLGVSPPTPTWGNMLMDSQATMASQPWLTVFPGMAILLTVLCVNFIGDGLQDALDPTL
ncbi:MAG: ABC transporter permease [Sphaerochaetaceae bacterium]|jgi:peptide/nickel transport system permease protein|nr:ABC transporter permease [Sphaerochaetaceae bacterium]MDX9939635.1 ABC transporter permease [Sphaerochaetaceae bacterium]